MGIAIALVLLVVGSLLFHYLSPWYFTPVASNWGTIDFTVNLTFWVTGVVFVAINLFVAYAIFRFRHRKGNRADYEPENKKLEGWLVGLTTIGVAALLAPGLFVWAKFVDVPKDAMVVEAVGRQWHWAFRFPGNDGVLGVVDAKYISDANPFGLKPDDPRGQDDVLVSNPQVHLPVGKPIKLLLRSIDVLHNFTVPQFRVKMDLVPGMVTHLWYQPTQTGRFDLLCEELCGIAHFAMRGKVVVQEEREFEAWLASQATFAQTMAKTPADVAAGQALYAVCSGCHGAQAEGNRDLNAPKLAGHDAMYLKQQLLKFKTGARGGNEKDTFGRQMAPMAATLADATALDNVVAYIASLPDAPAKETISANVVRGRKVYEDTCAACHGAKGQGKPAMNAPRLAGMNDWYLATQLRNFRNGVRGSHPADMYGQQMASMAAILVNDRTIDDIVTHINTMQ